LQRANKRTKLKENSLFLMNDQTQSGRGGASHILSSASCSEPTKPVAANSKTAIPTSPVQPCGCAVPAASSICLIASEPAGPITPSATEERIKQILGASIWLAVEQVDDPELCAWLCDEFSKAAHVAPIVTNYPASWTRH
jgi:hypothetical protein